MRGGSCACDMLYALIAQGTDIDTVQQMLARTEQDGRDGQVQLINKSCTQILPNCGNAATQPDVATVRRIPRLLQRSMNAVGYELEHSAALHRDPCSRMMGQHEDRRVIRRLLAPPAFPAVIRPRASDGAEHVAAENPRADSRETLRRNIVICACLAIITPVHSLPGTRVEEPVKQCRAAHSKRVLEILPRSSAVTVD